MATVTSICNLALTHLGKDTIADIDEAVETARRCKAVFDDTRDAVLRAHPWNCAMELASVPAAGTAPLWGYANAYPQPVDPWCLRVWRMQEPTTKFVVRGRKIHTDAAGPLNFEFIKRVTDPAEFDALLVQGLGLRLAHGLAFRMTGSRALREEMWTEYLNVIAEARSIDAQEGTPEDPQADEFLDARL